MSKEHGDTIKALRVKRTLSQLEVAERLGIARSSYIAIEQGKRDVTLGEFEKLSHILRVSFDEIESGVVANYEKYKQMILVFLRMGGKIPKTKLAKLLYFADFGWFYYHLESMSGMQYRKIQYGPVADSYFRIIDEMFDSGEINIAQTKDGAMLISQTRSGAKTSTSIITRDEEKFMKDIEKKWRGKKTAEIVDFTHKQFPYLFANDNDIVSYNIFTQENPDEVF